MYFIFLGYLKSRGNNSIQCVQREKEKREENGFSYLTFFWFDNRKWSLPAKKHCYVRMFSCDQSGTVGWESRTVH